MKLIYNQKQKQPQQQQKPYQQSIFPEKYNNKTKRI
jgi:hypothetical protein